MQRDRLVFLVFESLSAMQEDGSRNFFFCCLSYICVCIYINVCICMYVFVYVCMYIYIHTYIYMFVCVYICRVERGRLVYVIYLVYIMTSGCRKLRAIYFYVCRVEGGRLVCQSG